MAIFVPKVFCYKFRSFRREFGDFHRRIQDQEEVEKRFGIRCTTCFFSLMALKFVVNGFSGCATQ
jgi:hypothetical protein